MDDVKENNKNNEISTNCECEKQNWFARHSKAIKIGTGIAAAAGVAVGIVYVINNKERALEMVAGIGTKLIQSPKVETSQAMVAARPFSIIESTENKPLQEVCEKMINNGQPFTVVSHVRHLPEGMNPSVGKLAEAKDLGIVLEPGCTIVTGYTKNSMSA